ncbi:MAG: LPS translocon maturation chaperone LptM [Geminicoccaceae bacterium]
MSESSHVSPKPKVELSRPYADVRRRKLLLALGASVALAGCGKKGDLELPPAEPVLRDEQPGGDAQ